MQKLPYANFQWHYTQMTEKKVLKYSDDHEAGYILEVDLEYTEEIHALHYGLSVSARDYDSQ